MALTGSAQQYCPHPSIEIIKGDYFCKLCGRKLDLDEYILLQTSKSREKL